MLSLILTAMWDLPKLRRSESEIKLSAATQKKYIH